LLRNIPRLKDLLISLQTMPFLPKTIHYCRSFWQKWLFPMIIDYLSSDNETTKWHSGFIQRVYIVVPLLVLPKRIQAHYTIIIILNYCNHFLIILENNEKEYNQQIGCLKQEFNRKSFARIYKYFKTSLRIYDCNSCKKSIKPTYFYFSCFENRHFAFQPSGYSYYT